MIFRHIAFAGAAAFSLSALAYATPSLADMNDMKTAHDYFVAHSFDFPKNFRFQHPGPEWVLQHEKDFNLTSDQTTELKKMSTEMFDDMKRLDARTQDAYAKYEKDAAQRDPTAATLKADIDDIGKEEAALAYTMIPFHLRSYALLTADQKKTFDDLVEKGAGSK